MNIRKAVDYSTMFATLESVMKADLPQMELYCEIGKAVCAHSEKGAAVAAAEFIKEQYPDMTGFSPRNVRRMHDFYKVYENETSATTKCEPRLRTHYEIEVADGTHKHKAVYQHIEDCKINPFIIWLTNVIADPSDVVLKVKI